MNLNSRDPYYDDITTVILDQVRVHSRLNVDSYLLSSARLSVQDQTTYFADQLALQLEAFVLQEKLPPEYIVEDYTVSTPPVPVTWWDHFKVEKLNGERWYWKWLGKLKSPKFTVEVKTVKLSVNLKRFWNYPEAKAVSVQMGKPYKFAQWDTEIMGL